MTLRSKDNEDGSSLLTRRRLTTLTAISAAANYFLVAHSRSLKNTVATLNRERRLNEGDLIEAIEIVDVSGSIRKVHFEGAERPSILYVFSPGCRWSKRNQTNMNFLAMAKSSSYQFLGLSITSEGLGVFVDAHNPPYEIGIGPLGSGGSALSRGGVPQTAAIGTDGKVVRYWMGAYTPGIRHDVESFFGVALASVESD
ncbi:MAG: hypothetical protein IPM24_16925 [Bryobacterales bacterium]|nr:hypothetical protein [Bryobacterales bacterium]